MNTLRRTLCLLASLCLLAAPGSSGPALAADVVVAPDRAVAGQTQAEWSRRWWVWASSFPAESSPIADRSGARCGAGQSAPVWFLAGAFGSALVERTCTVPGGTYLFFPLVNYVVFPPPESALTCAAASDQARRMTDSPSVLVAELDGHRIDGLALHRQATPACFNLAERADVRTVVYPSAANGYYLMLSPLAPGRHTLRFGGHVGALRQAIRYELDVR